MKVSGKNNYIILCAIFLAINTLFVVGAVLLTKKITASGKTVGDEIAKLDKRRLSVENLRANLSLTKEVDKKLTSYDRFFFTQGQELQLITDLESIAAKNKMTQKIDSSNLDNYANNRIDIVVSAAGAYANALRYMTDLENYRYMLAINSINLQPAGSAGPDGSQFPVTLRLNLSLYASPNNQTTTETK